jgi:phage virion morphogenesis protein
MINFTIKSNEVQALFKQLGFNTQNIKPALFKIGAMLEDASENAFDRQGPGWKSLKPSTKKQRARKGHTGKILQRSGALANSVTSQIKGNAVFIGSNLEYARAHQLGNRRNNLPKREYLILSEAELRKSNFILSKHMVRGT